MSEPAASAFAEDERAWQALEQWLRSDPEGHRLLEDFSADPVVNARKLQNWLEASAPNAPQPIVNIVTGGRVERIINIAQAERVVLNVLLPAEKRLHQLPPDIEDFTGRSSELKDLLSLIDKSHYVLIYGMPGVGKSALANRVCHILQAKFPDAQLYLNLRGDEGGALKATEALAACLKAFGLSDSAIPSDLDTRAAHFRGLLADKRAIVFLDNAQSEAQVRPLFAASPNCRTIITSRNNLAALEGVSPFPVDILLRDDAYDLLAAIAGTDRVGGEPDPAYRILELAGRLPLAIRIAAGTLRKRPERTLASYADGLEDERSRLTKLQLGDLAVRSSFNLSYKELGQEDARLFRRLAMLPGPVLSTDLAEQLDGPGGEARSALDRLADAQLVQYVADALVRMHDLMRVFARERLAAEETAVDLLEVWRRVGRWYATMCAHAQAYLDTNVTKPSGKAEARADRVQDVFAWFDLEFTNLVFVAKQLKDVGLWNPILPITSALLRFLLSLRRSREASEVLDLAFETTRQVGGNELRASLLVNQASFHLMRGEWALARTAIEESLGLFRAERNRIGELQALGTLVMILTEQNELSEADRLGETVLTAYRYEFPQLRSDLASTLVAMGNLRVKTVRWNEAIPLFEEATEIGTSISDFEVVRAAQQSLGVAYSNLGRWNKALEANRSVIRQCKLLGDQLGAASAGNNAASILHRQGETQRAFQLSLESLEVCRRFGARLMELECLVNLGTFYTDTGDWRQSTKSLDAALQIAREHNDDSAVARILSTKANMYARQRQWTAAMTLYNDAMSTYERLGFAHKSAEIKLSLAGALIQSNQFDAAVKRLEEAIPVFEAAGDVHATARASANLGLAYANLGKPEKTVTEYQQAIKTFQELGDLEGLGHTSHNLGRFLAQSGHFKQALQYFQIDLQICEQLGDRPGVMETLWQIAEAYSGLGNFREAASRLNRYVDVARALDDQEAEGRALGNLASLAASEGNIAAALEFGKQSLAILNALNLPEAAAVTAFLDGLG